MPEGAYTFQEIRVVRPADRSASEAYFGTEIAGNTVTRFGLVDVCGPCLQLAYAQTDAGGHFHSSTTEAGQSWRSFSQARAR